MFSGLSVAMLLQSNPQTEWGIIVIADQLYRISELLEEFTAKQESAN